jgi:8-oxo-dGTP diphosphatase
MIRTLADIDWDNFAPHDTATLMFIIRGGQVLLIRKLRGLGAGKINAPGGRREGDETLAATAIRETIEEVGVTPHEPRERGLLQFAFADGYRLQCHVFSSDGCDGEATESPEAIPLWTPLEAIPYAEMWADDALWVPRMLAGRTPFHGRFVFEGDAMLDVDLRCHDPAEALFERLSALRITTHTVAHAPVFTVREAQAVRATTGEGLHTRNLFLRDKKGRMWLFTVAEDRPVDLAALAAHVGTRHFTFGSPARLRAHLGVEPGSVTPFAVMHDTAQQVGFVLDSTLADAPDVHVHPLTNDRTTRISGSDLVRFAAACGHEPVFLDGP